MKVERIFLMIPFVGIELLAREGDQFFECGRTRSQIGKTEWNNHKAYPISLLPITATNCDPCCCIL